MRDQVARSWLTPEQIERVDQALQESFQEYLVIEAQNLQQSIDEQGHVITVIPPLSTELGSLENQFWTRLDSILDREQQNIFRLNLELSPPQPMAGMLLRDLVRPGFFGWGQQGARIEIWKEGAWFRWKTGTSHYENTETGPELPEEYRRFWKEPSEK